MKMRFQLIALSLGMAALAQSALAEKPKADHKGHREERQALMKKIKANMEEGRKNGAFTKEERETLRASRAKLKQARVEAKADGKVTPEEREALFGQLKSFSDQVDQLAHNDQKREKKSN